MEIIIQLLKQKNHFLEKLFKLNEREYQNYLNQNFDNLENFYQSREKIIDTVLFIDAKIDRAHAQISPDSKCTDEFRIDLKNELRIKDRLAKTIQQQDLEILSVIEDAKSKIIKELQEVKKIQKGMGGYKSSTRSLRLDEEV